jgi:hypothetical protein
MRLLAVTLMACIGSQDPQDKPPLTAHIDGAIKVYEFTTDDWFLYRLALDLTGAEWAKEDVAAFEADKGEGRRLRAIDRYLADDRFADHWAKKFADAFFADPRSAGPLHIDGLKPLVGKRLQDEFAKWLAAQLKADRPWNEIVAEMLAAKGKTEANPALAYKVSFFRDAGFATEIAEGMTRHFLGIRIGCARCHDHPFDGWKDDDYHGLAAFFVRQTARAYLAADGSQHVELTETAAGEGQQPPKWLFGGKPGEGVSRAQALVELATHKSNTWLARSLVNRAWAWLIGRGISHPTDEFNRVSLSRQDPKGLLEPLTKDMVENKYSIKRVVRAICASNVYRMRQPDPADPRPAVDDSWKKYRLPPEPSRNLTTTGLPGVPPFDRPEAWIAQTAVRLHQRPTSGSLRAVYAVPDKEKRAADALLVISNTGDPEAGVRSALKRAEGAKSERMALEGKHAVTLVDSVGRFTCDQDLPAYTETRMLHGIVRREKGSVWFFTLIGPPETVGDWRDDFEKMLKTADPAK